MTDTARAIRIAILAMGGEGGGVLANWIVDLAEHGGHVAQMTSVPGVAQRTGATIYYVELFPEGLTGGGREPVLALMPMPGDVDVVIASELMEAGRAVQRGLVTPDRTTLIASTHRVYAMTEKLALADGRVDADALLDACRSAAQRLVSCNMARIAEETGSIISAVMFGALAASGTLPFDRDAFEATIARGGVGVAASTRAFGRGFDAASGREDAGPPPAEPAAPAPLPAPTELARLAGDAAAFVPPPALAIVRAGLERLLDYQDVDYARLYLERLKPVVEADRRHGDGSFRLTADTARYLALGMAYEDTIRVAELKIRADRFARVAEEVRLRDGQILEIAEFLHPRLQEIAETVPAPLGRFIQRNALARKVVEAMTASGKIVKTTSLRGFLALYAVASLKPWRRKSLRYPDEQQQLDAWLTKLLALAARSWPLAVEFAECRNLVKGYGDTHARGRASYETIAALADQLAADPAGAGSLAALRHAALADDTGQKLKDAVERLDFSGPAQRAAAE